LQRQLPVTQAGHRGIRIPRISLKKLHEADQQAGKKYHTHTIHGKKYSHPVAAKHISAKRYKVKGFRSLLPALIRGKITRVSPRRESNYAQEIAAARALEARRDVVTLLRGGRFGAAVVPSIQLEKKQKEKELNDTLDKWSESVEAAGQELEFRLYFTGYYTNEGEPEYISVEVPLKLSPGMSKKKLAKKLDFAKKELESLEPNLKWEAGSMPMASAPGRGYRYKASRDKKGRITGLAKDGNIKVGAARPSQISL
jgi:hypothetical protein